MAKIEKEVVITHPQGLHARPAAIFVQIASKYDAKVCVQKGEEEVNGKSIMGILMLAVESHSRVTIKAEGMDAEQAIVELEKFLTQEENEITK